MEKLSLPGGDIVPPPPENLAAYETATRLYDAVFRVMETWQRVGQIGSEFEATMRHFTAELAEAGFNIPADLGGES